MNKDLLEQKFDLPFGGGSTYNLALIVQVVSEQKMFINMYMVSGQGQTTPTGYNCLIYT